MAAKYKKLIVPVGDGRDFPIYASSKHQHALATIGNMTMFEGVKMTDLLYAVYVQGRKEGAANAFAEVQNAVASAADLVPHRNPGQPKKAKRPKKAKDRIKANKK